MKRSHLLSLTITCTALIVPVPSSASDGTSFIIAGEQLVLMPPKDWKLAWMDGIPNGRYLMEYIPEKENIDSWREGYLAIERLPYPSRTDPKEIDSSRGRLASLALNAYLQIAANSCVGKHILMSQRVNTFNGTSFAVGGGFCDKYGSAAPFGEGAFVAFAEGKSHIFRIQYSWRPKSTDDKSNLPWRITQETAKQYLEAIKASSLCGEPNQPVCPESTVEPSVTDQSETPVTR